MTTAPFDRRPLYEHRQIGWPILASALVPFIGLAAWWGTFPSIDHTLPAFLAEWSWAMPSDDRGSLLHLVPLLGGLALVSLGFSWLTVVLTPTHLAFRFGIGLFRRTIPLTRIGRARVVRSRWYEGWGIHWTRGGMLYNVGGFDAVALELRDGKTLRIGSDDAARLQRAIERAIAEAGAASRAAMAAR